MSIKPCSKFPIWSCNFIWVTRNFRARYLLFISSNKRTVHFSRPDPRRLLIAINYRSSLLQNLSDLWLKIKSWEPPIPFELFPRIALNSGTWVSNNNRTVPSGNRGPKDIFDLHNLSNLCAKFERLWLIFKSLKKENSFWAFSKISPKTAERYISRDPARGHFWSS
jgi:hypothetical protein